MTFLKWTVSMEKVAHEKTIRRWQKEEWFGKELQKEWWVRRETQDCSVVYHKSMTGAALEVYTQFC